MKLEKSKHLRILFATDAWHPQVNGVVRTLSNVIEELRALDHEVRVLSHQGKRTWGLPSYPEIQLAFFSQKEISRAVEDFRPDAIHIVSEGPLGIAMRKYCLRHNLPFTTGFHTRFAEYLKARVPVPGLKSVAYWLLRNFHKHSSAVLSPTLSVSQDLESRGFTNVVTWTRGVDHTLFKDYAEVHRDTNASPILIYVGRIAVEKGVEDFLQLSNKGQKIVIGDGPSKFELEERYPDVVFTGYLFGEELARKISTGSVFVFPSRTDTFGLVMLEAMACGLPVAAYPVIGPIDVVDDGYSGCLDDDLEIAVTNALNLKREDAIAHAAKFTWKNTALQFLDNLALINPPLDLN